MSQEGRHESLSNTVADGTTASNSVSEFRNDSSGFIHIRGATYAHQLRTAQVNEQGQIELSKSPVMAATTNNNVFFTWMQSIASNGGAADDTSAINGGRKWGRGQLVLEPNESLFVNVTKTSGGIIVFSYVLEYEFQRSG